MISNLGISIDNNSPAWFGSTEFYIETVFISKHKQYLLNSIGYAKYEEQIESQSTITNKILRKKISNILHKIGCFLSRFSNQRLNITHQTSESKICFAFKIQMHLHFASILFQHSSTITHTRCIQNKFIVFWICSHNYS